MCGIAGTLDGSTSRVERMLDAMAHRGPDGRATSQGARACLGATRLAIRGGREGDQPLKTRRGLLVFNGEIYNTAELVKDLARHHFAVSGESDTEIVGALLDVYGMRAVDRLNGMYALAWDDGENVWLARDPAGIKPLYYSGSSFASEIKPLLEGGASLCGDALTRWLTFHYAYGADTFFEGVKRVPPGTVMALPDARVVRTDAALTFGEPNPSLTEDRLRKVLERSVRDAIPDEPFGVCLSGGVDSSLIAALAGKATAYHGRVDGPGCDESPHARAAAAELHLDLVCVDITAEACLDALPRVIRALEEPVAGPGSVAQWLVAERASRDVRILFSGCGGDELFGGYARAAAVVRDTPPPGLESYAPLFDKVRGLDPAARAFACLDRRTPGLFRKEFMDAHPAPREEFLEAFAMGRLDPLAAAARAETALVLPALLQVEDRVTMAFSVESRVPLLDRRLLRSASRLPPKARVSADGRLKARLREAAEPILPAAVRSRTDKMGFPLPLGDWLRGPWKTFVLDVLLDRRTRERNMIDPGGVQDAIARPGPYDRGLYSALLLELWCRTFLDD